jgi:hypothetical protein
MFTDQLSYLRNRPPTPQLPQGLQSGAVLCVLFAQIALLQGGFVFLPPYLQTYSMFVKLYNQMVSSFQFTD